MATERPAVATGLRGPVVVNRRFPLLPSSSARSEATGGGGEG